MRSVSSEPPNNPAQRTKIASSKRIANPGCYATGFIALTHPLVSAGLLKPEAALVASAISGYSGGGKALIGVFEGEEAHEPWGAYGERRRHVPAFPAVSSPNPNEIQTQSE